VQAVVDLTEFVYKFGRGMTLADSAAPLPEPSRTGRQYAPGIGTHSEDATVTLVFAALESAGIQIPHQREVPYPAIPRNKCDVVLLGEPKWAIEIKMLRLLGDNGKPNGNMLMHILSPYPHDRSALTDCLKLLQSGFDSNLAILIYGFDYPNLPLDPAIEAFERLAMGIVQLSPRVSCQFESPTHSIQSKGRVFAWEIASLSP
jgi:hypothetical protein